MTDELQILLSEARRYDTTDFKSIKPIPGLDIAFEKGEQYTTGNGKITDRIVRIGFSNNVQQRIAFHYEGSMEGSVFRANVGQALGEDADDAAVSDYFARNISFAVVPSGKVLKARLIATLFQNDSFNHSANWAGLKAGMNKLWQTNNLQGPVLNQQQLFQLNNLLKRTV